jgi:hypothetical protein
MWRGCWAGYGGWLGESNSVAAPFGFATAFGRAELR